MIKIAFNIGIKSQGTEKHFSQPTCNLQNLVNETLVIADCERLNISSSVILHGFVMLHVKLQLKEENVLHKFDQSFISHILRIIGRLGEKCDLFSHLGIDIQRDSDLKISKIKFHSIRASESYLHEKNMIYGRETATV